MEWNHVPLAPRPNLRSQARGVYDHGTGMGAIANAEAAPSVKIAIQYACDSLFCISFWVLIWNLAALGADSYFVLLKTFTSKYISSLCPVLLFAWLNAISGKMYFWARMKSMTSLQHSWGSSEVSVSRLWHVSMCKSRLMPRCLMPIGSFWSWCASLSLWLLTCCHEKKQKIIRLWPVL